MKVDLTVLDLINSYSEFLKAKFGKEFNFTGGYTLDKDGNEEDWVMATGVHYIRFISDR
jgi:hypothetical protein